MEFDVVKAERFAPMERKVLQLPPAFARPPNPGISFQSDAVMPAEFGADRPPAVGLHKPVVGEHDDLAPLR